MITNKLEMLVFAPYVKHRGSPYHKETSMDWFLYDRASVMKELKILVLVSTISQYLENMQGS